MRFKDSFKNYTLVLITAMALLLDALISINAIWGPDFRWECSLIIMYIASKLWVAAFITINVICRLNDNEWHYDEDEDYVNHKVNIYTIEK